VKAVGVDLVTDLILAVLLCAVWLTAGLMADALPGATDARQLRRRAGVLYAVVVGGAAVFVALPLVTDLVPGGSKAPQAALLAAVPGARLVTVPGAAVAGVAMTVVGAAVLVIAVRAGLRHSRLSVLALAPVRGRRWRGR
jgi:hypothetical protein